MFCFSSILAGQQVVISKTLKHEKLSEKKLIKVKKLAKQVERFKRTTNTVYKCKKFLDKFCKKIKKITGTRFNKKQVLKNVYLPMHKEGFACHAYNQKKIESLLLGGFKKTSKERFIDKVSGELFELQATPRMIVGVTTATCGYIISLFDNRECVSMGEDLIRSGARHIVNP